MITTVDENVAPPVTPRPPPVILTLEARVATPVTDIVDANVAAPVTPSPPVIFAFAAPNIVP